MPSETRARSLKLSKFATASARHFPDRRDDYADCDNTAVSDTSLMVENHSTVWDFVDSESSVQPRAMVRCLESPKLAAAERARIRLAGEKLTAAMRNLLDDPSLSDFEAMLLLGTLDEGQSRKRNPIWAWLMLDFYAQAGLPPSGWVFEYLLNASCEIANAVLERSAPSLARGTKAKSVAVEALGLKRGAGVRNHMRTLAVDISQLKLAIAVKRLVDDKETLETASKKVVSALRGIHWTQARKAYTEAFGKLGHRNRPKTRPWFGPDMRGSFTDKF